MASTASDIPGFPRSTRKRRRRRRRKLGRMAERWKNHLPSFIVALAATVIGGYIVARLSGTPPSEIAAILWAPFGATSAWLAAPARLTNWDFIQLSLILIALNYLAGGRRLRRVKDLAMRNISNHEDRLRDIEDHVTRPSVEPQAAPQVSASESQKFEPEAFDLTPPRCRALMGLLQRVDAQTTLHDLHQMVVQVGMMRDTRTTKGQLQHDMEEAEALGIVSIDRVGTLTAYYSLTSKGRDFVLTVEKELRRIAAAGMQRVDPRYF